MCSCLFFSHQFLVAVGLRWHFMPHTQLQQTFVGTVYMYVRGTACSLYIAHIIGVAKVYCSCSYLLSPHHLQTKLNVLAMRVDCRAARGSWLLVIETLLRRVQWSPLLRATARIKDLFIFMVHFCLVPIIRFTKPYIRSDRL